jgi:hypothetical protein
MVPAASQGLGVYDLYVSFVIALAVLAAGGNQ